MSTQNNKVDTTVHSARSKVYHSDGKAVADVPHILHELRHYLPSQTPIKDFIHHNSLHAYQHMKFYEAIFKASKIFGFQATLQLTEFRELYAIGRIKNEVLEHVIEGRKGKGGVNLDTWRDRLLRKSYDVNNTPRIGQLRAEWKNQYQVDLDNLVQPLLFRIVCSYLDQGISLHKVSSHDDGFLASIKELEQNSFTSFFKTKRAKELLLSDNLDCRKLLQIVVGQEEYFEQYLFDQQFTHQGWSGIVAAVEDSPHTLMDSRKISLMDFVMLELLLEIDALDHSLGKDWEPLGDRVEAPPVDLFAHVDTTELQEVFILWQDAFEWSYYDEVLSGMQQLKTRSIETIGEGKSTSPNLSFQAIFCIDERECSIRRHVEAVDRNCETFGSPGFFGVEFYFQPENGKFYEKLCPAPVTPKYLIKEEPVSHKRGHELLYTPKTHTLLEGTLGTLSLGFMAAIRLFQTMFRPRMSPAISNAFSHMNKKAPLVIENRDVNHRENDLQVGFTVPEMAARVEGLLRGIGMVKDFAPLVYVMAHGSSSANNPHHSAHDCGACSGRPGSVNARVFAHMANHREVRNILKEKGLAIPESTWFVGAMHDTAADQMDFYDADILDDEKKQAHQVNLVAFEEALDRNATERSRRFASINTKRDLKKVRKDILDRSVSMFEPRPELGHGTNTLCIVGNRDITKGLFLDRRAFLNSYDYRTDPDGSVLTGVMRPIGLVCGGINLEYYFSRVDNHKLGAGTKLPHNIMGLFGVANSSDGDLRPGLPVQMIEVHDPVRLLIVVEHQPEIVLKSIQSTPEIYEWYLNEWVHLIALHPGTNKFHYFKNGEFTIYDPITPEVPAADDILKLVTDAKEMETNYIVDATVENLPVHLVNES
ncbi:MAG: DUF2309 domain-containing protein [Chitinophagaceae bacterium]|nr:DUF2309 domain-containing protein [Chitinophagaceae bacterium]